MRNKLNIIKNDISNLETIKLKNKELIKTLWNDGDIYVTEFKDTLKKFKTKLNLNIILKHKIHNIRSQLYNLNFYKTFINYFFSLLFNLFLNFIKLIFLKIKI